MLWRKTKCYTGMKNPDNWDEKPPIDFVLFNCTLGQTKEWLVGIHGLGNAEEGAVA